MRDAWEIEERKAEAARKYQAEVRRRNHEARWRGAIGSLHAVGCSIGGRHRGTRYCSPIPVYRGEQP